MPHSWIGWSRPDSARDERHWCQSRTFRFRSRTYAKSALYRLRPRRSRIRSRRFSSGIAAIWVYERGLAESSISVELRIAERFCSKRALDLKELSAAEVTASIAAFAAQSFLRFLHTTGITTQPFAAALPKLAGHRRNVSCEFDEHDFARLLEGCDRSRDVGLRDCAILTVLWRLGLRRGEAAGLKFDDIDWRRSEITIRGKATACTPRPTCTSDLPLESRRTRCGARFGPARASRAVRHNRYPEDPRPADRRLDRPARRRVQGGRP